jgi:antitoxin component YwqK of YwqJK toxin-antitoxin module
MKNKLLIGIIIAFLSSCGPKKVGMNELVLNDSIYYTNDSEKPFTGEVIALFGEKKMTLGKMLNGKKDGEWTEWYGIDKKSFVGSFLSGNPDGKWIFYFPNGSIREERNYSSGKLNGKWTSYFENSVISTDCVYENEILNGEYTQNWDNGNVKVKCNYLKGNLTKQYTSYFNNGQKEMSGEYLIGKRNGEWSEWFENGLLKLTDNYLDDQKNGVSISYLPPNYGTTWANDGRKRVECHYTNGILNGKYTWWFRKGTLESNNLVQHSFGGTTHTYLEGCFVNGQKDGIFKFWLAVMSFNPVLAAENDYYRQVWQNGQMIDDGWDEHGHPIKYDASDNISDKFSLMSLKNSNERDLLMKKYPFGCD